MSNAYELYENLEKLKKENANSYKMVACEKMLEITDILEKEKDYQKINDILYNFVAEILNGDIKDKENKYYFEYFCLLLDTASIELAPKSKFI